MPVNRVNISIIGAGRAGSALACLMSDSGYGIGSVIDKDSDRARALAERAGAVNYASSPAGLYDEFDVLLIAVPDDAIANTVEVLAQSGKISTRCTVVHVSGLHTADILDPCTQQGACAASFHPCTAFSPAQPVITPFYTAIEGDARAVEIMTEIAKTIGAVPFTVSAADKALYHNACTWASNYLVTVLSTAVSVTEGMEPAVPPEALMGLAEQSVKNFFAGGGAGALTGPIARGDINTVSAHIQALLKKDRAAALLYCRIGKHTVNLALKQGGDTQAIGAIDRLFDSVIQDTAHGAG